MATGRITPWVRVATVFPPETMSVTNLSAAARQEVIAVPRLPEITPKQSPLVGRTIFNPVRESQKGALGRLFVTHRDDEYLISRDIECSRGDSASRMFHADASFYPRALRAGISAFSACVPKANQ